MEAAQQSIIQSMHLLSEEDEALRELHYILFRLLDTNEDPNIYTNPEQLLRLLRAREFDQEATILMWDKWRDWRMSA